jgi:hypothetical protein
MTDVVCAFFRGEQVQGTADEVPEGVDGSGLGLPQHFLEFGEGHLDRIEIGAVGRQERRRAPTPAMRRAASSFLWLDKLSRITVSPSRSAGTRICST